MGILKKIKGAVRSLTDKETRVQNEKLSTWQRRLMEAERAWAPRFSLMDRCENVYRGTYDVYMPDAQGASACLRRPRNGQ
jgi:hypothetical protein